MGIKSRNIEPSGGIGVALKPCYEIRDGFFLGPAVDMSGSNLSGKDLSGLDLSGAIFTASNLTGVDLRGAQLHNALLNDTNLNEVVSGDLSYNQFSIDNLNTLYRFFTDIIIGPGRRSYKCQSW